MTDQNSQSEPIRDLPPITNAFTDVSRLPLPSVIPAPYSEPLPSLVRDRPSAQSRVPWWVWVIVLPVGLLLGGGLYFVMTIARDTAANVAKVHDATNSTVQEVAELRDIVITSNKKTASQIAQAQGYAEAIFDRVNKEDERLNRHEDRLAKQETLSSGLATRMNKVEKLLTAPTITGTINARDAAAEKPCQAAQKLANGQWSVNYEGKPIAVKWLRTNAAGQAIVQDSAGVLFTLTGECAWGKGE